MRTHFDIHHEGTLGTQDRTAMTFDENSIAHLMTVLTDLYSNPTLAVVREYSTNAWDAHVAAGNPDPIRVKLPNPMNNMLVIKDFGTGMSKDDITDHFSKYGWSSKRDNDEETGMLGLGCKSGLTYTSQFTLVTTQDGIQNTVLVTREESGGGVVQIIDTCATDEPNGTEVQIPCKSYSTMQMEARNYFQYWSRGTVLVDEEEPECIWEDPSAITVDPDIILLPSLTDRRSGQKATSMVVMGNVASPVNEYKLPTHLQNNNDRLRAIIRVPVGSVNFVPSREALQYTKRTLETIEDAWEYINRGLVAVVQEKIDATTNPKEAFYIWQEWQQVLYYAGRHRSFGKVTYRGTPFKATIDVPDSNRTLLLPLRKNSWSETDRSERIQGSIKLQRAYECVLHVVGHQGTAIAAPTKARIRAYAATKGLTEGNVLVYPHLFGAPWLTNDTCNRVRFDVIQKIQLPDQVEKERVKRQRSKYRMLIDQYTLDYQDELPETCESWIPAAWNDVSRQDVVAFSGSGKVAVVLAAAQKAFERDHPTIPNWIDWAKDQCKTVPLSGTEWDSLHYYEKQAANTYPYRVVSQIPKLFVPLSGNKEWVDLLADPALRSLHTEWKHSVKPAEKFENRMWTVRNMGRNFPDLVIPEVPKFTRIKDELTVLKTFYEGLLDMEPHLHIEAFIKALNSVYIVKQSLHTIPVL